MEALGKELSEFEDREFKEDMKKLVNTEEFKGKFIAKLFKEASTSKVVKTLKGRIEIVKRFIRAALLQNSKA